MIYKYIPLILLSIGFGCKKGIEVTQIRTMSKPTTSNSQSTPTKAVVMIIPLKNFRDEELKVTYDYLKEKGYTVYVASTETTEATGMLGMKFKPDIVIKDIDPAKWDALVLVGGTGSTVFFNDTAVQSIARSFDDNNKVVAAICLAPVMLARAGILKDKNATCFEDVAENLKSGGANYTGSRVEISGRIITASGPEAAKEFAVAIANELR